jgi:hypothetical protein
VSFRRERGGELVRSARRYKGSDALDNVRVIAISLGDTVQL